MDRERFDNACKKILGQPHRRTGIGTYSEKTVHAVLKKYFEPFEDSHERKTGDFIADIVGENGIMEIQTAGFNRLRKKLEAFLSVSRVTVVYPIPYQKWLISISEKTGELGKRRKSPKTGSVYEAFAELYKIKPYLTHKNFSFCIMLIDMEEYRCAPEKTGLRRGRRKGFMRCERIPLALVDEIHIRSIEDWQDLIPGNIGNEFTSKELSECAGVSLSSARLALNIFYEVGAVKKLGKRGNSIVYCLSH